MQQVSRLHFLVHPGFTTDPDACPQEDRDTRTIDRYLKNARSLAKDEIVVAYPHSTSGQFRDDYEAGKLYAERLLQLKMVLRRRLVVFFSAWNVLDYDEHAEKSLKVLGEILAVRGFVFNAQTPTVAYGEVIGECVDAAAKSLHEAGKFKEKTKVITELCDAKGLQMTEEDPRIEYV